MRFFLGRAVGVSRLQLVPRGEDKPREDVACEVKQYGK